MSDSGSEEMMDHIQVAELVNATGASNESSDKVNTQPCPTGSPPKKRKTIKDRSKAWDHFERYVDKDGTKKSKCKYCNQVYDTSSKGCGTSNLLGHMERCVKFPSHLKVDKTQKQIAFQPIKGGEKGEVSLVPWQFDQDMCRRALARMIIVDELPFNVVEKEGFRSFVRTVQPMFYVPSRSTVTRDCFEIYNEKKQALRKYFKETRQRISITTDTWTSIQRINYMCLTSHFIDKDWKLHKKILNFCPINSHKGQDLASGVSKCLLELGVDKVFAVIVDNASSNDVMVKELSKQLTKWNTNMMEGEHLHVRCMAHIINLVVQDGLKDGSVSVERVRQAVRYIRQSPARWNRFKDCCDLDKLTSKKSLCLDVPTRWNFTYLMLSVAVVYEEAFTKYCDIDFGLVNYITNYLCEDEEAAGALLSSDWESVRHIVKFLEIFYELTLKVSGSLYVTSNVHFLEICEVGSSLKELMESEDPVVRKMAKNMREKFMKYWGDPIKMNKMIFIPCVLDPRHKFNSLSFALTSMFGQIQGAKLKEEIRTYMSSLFDVYAKNNVKSYSSCPSSPTSSSTSSGIICSSSPDSLEKKKVSRFMQDLNRHKNGRCTDSKTELDKYLAEDIEEDRDGFDILLWWKVNSLRFPSLGEMARDVLAFPISSVASESSFSTGGRILDPFRSSLTPRMVQELVCVQDWLRNESTPVRIEEDLEKLEQLELDMINTGRESCIVDI